jgi:hypothetical protein
MNATVYDSNTLEAIEKMVAQLAASTPKPGTTGRSYTVIETKAHGQVTLLADKIDAKHISIGVVATTKVQGKTAEDMLEAILNDYDIPAAVRTSGITKNTGILPAEAGANAGKPYTYYTVAVEELEKYLKQDKRKKAQTETNLTDPNAVIDLPTSNDVTSAEADQVTDIDPKVLVNLIPPIGDGIANITKNFGAVFPPKAAEKFAAVAEVIRAGTAMAPVMVELANVVSGMKVKGGQNNQPPADSPNPVNNADKPITPSDSVSVEANNVTTPLNTVAPPPLLYAPRLEPLATMLDVSGIKTQEGLGFIRDANKRPIFLGDAVRNIDIWLDDARNPSAENHSTAKAVVRQVAITGALLSEFGFLSQETGPLCAQFMQEVGFTKQDIIQTNSLLHKHRLSLNANISSNVEAERLIAMANVLDAAIERSTVHAKGHGTKNEAMLEDYKLYADLLRSAASHVLQGSSMEKALDAANTRYASKHADSSITQSAGRLFRHAPSGVEMAVGIASALAEKGYGGEEGRNAVEQFKDTHGKNLTIPSTGRLKEAMKNELMFETRGATHVKRGAGIGRGHGFSAADGQAMRNIGNAMIENGMNGYTLNWDGKGPVNKIHTLIDRDSAGHAWLKITPESTHAKSELNTMVEAVKRIREEYLILHGGKLSNKEMRQFIDQPIDMQDIFKVKLKGREIHIDDEIGKKAGNGDKKAEQLQARYAELPKNFAHAVLGISHCMEATLDVKPKGRFGRYDPNKPYSIEVQFARNDIERVHEDVVGKTTERGMRALVKDIAVAVPSALFRGAKFGLAANGVANLAVAGLTAATPAIADAIGQVVMEQSKQHVAALAAANPGIPLYALDNILHQTFQQGIQQVSQNLTVTGGMIGELSKRAAELPLIPGSYEVIGKVMADVAAGFGLHINNIAAGLPIGSETAQNALSSISTGASNLVGSEFMLNASQSATNLVNGLGIADNVLQPLGIGAASILGHSVLKRGMADRSTEVTERNIVDAASLESSHAMRHEHATSLIKEIAKLTDLTIGKEGKGGIGSE